jgi:polyhydroxybutyrate depolymerase
MVVKRIAILAAAALAAVAPCAAAQSDVTVSMEFGGAMRSAIVHLPPGFSASQPCPLVVALHPAFSSGASFQSSSGWDAVANARGVVVVYPNGSNTSGSQATFTWNSWEFGGQAPDDAGFLSALIARMHADFGTDPCRTYMTGFSNGAMMANSFVGLHAGQVAAIAPVSGGWITAYSGDASDLNPPAPVPVWTWRGGNENFTTGVGSNARPRSQQDEEQLAFWVTHNGAALAETVSESLTYGLTRTYVTRIHAGNAPVRFTEVQGTGHVYQPGAAELIWNRFFSQIEAQSDGCAGCSADLDRSGAVDGADLGVLLNAWGPCSGCPADLDRSGSVDGSDLGALLAAWGAC